MTRLRPLLGSAVLEIVLVALCLFLAAVAPNFLTAENLLNVLRNVSMQGLIALGMTLVIIAGEIDLSVGSMVAFSGCLTAWLTGALGTPGAGLPVPLAVGAAILLSLAAGCLSGSLAGLLRNRFGVPSFISTLALLTALSGAAELITNGFPLTPFPGWYNFIGGGYLLGIPFPALLFVIAFAGTHMLMNYTAFGRAVYAVGGNAEAARLSAINIRTVRTAVLALTATLAAASGVMQSSEIMSGTATTAKGWELDVIAAAVIGGTSFSGGIGTIPGAVLGAVVMQSLRSGMLLLRVDSPIQDIVVGSVLVAAVGLDTIIRRRSA